MTTFDYTTFDLLNPAGTNGLSSYALYFQRLMYKEEIYPSNLITPLDTWYDKQYYGVVDRTQNTIIPQLANLAPITKSTTENLLALNFVARAFDKFAIKMQSATIGRVLASNGNTKILNMTARRAYKDPSRLYQSYLQQLYSSFTNTLSEKQQREIVDFRTFVAAFARHMTIVASTVPVTKTNYLLTNIVSVLNSGLAISIDNGPPEDDEYKYTNWINDPNFDFYIKAAKKFGFSVNKNIPWVLTADLFSDAMMEHLDPYLTDDYELITKNNFFETYYEKTYLTDIQNLKNYLVNSYTLFLTNNPIYQTREHKPQCDKTTIKTFNRSHLPANVGGILTDKYMLDLYLNLRSIEVGSPIQISRKIRQEIAQVYHIQPDKSVSPLQNAAEYINLIFRDYIYTVDYLVLNDNLLKNLDNQARTGNISTAGAVTQQLY